MSDRVSLAVPDVRNRLLGFAFASADLLVETRPDATITWTAGAFRARFGQEPEAFVGRSIANLITADDQSAMLDAMAGACRQGRVSPLVLRLNDAAMTPCAVGVLALPGAEPRLCVTLGPLPVAAPTRPAHPVRERSFARSLDEQVRGGQSGMLALLEIVGWAAATAALPPDQATALRSQIERALCKLAGSGALVSTLGNGKFSMMAPDQLDLTPAGEDIKALMPGSWPANGGTVGSVTLGLAPDGLTGPQAVRALRFALDRFVRGGREGLMAAGFSDGLTGFVRHANARAQAVRQAITARRLRLAFQPVVSLPDRVVHHHEALLRPVPHPSLPVHGTYEFVTFAEAVGLSEELDLAVLDLALEALQAAPEACVAANMSGLSVQSEAFHALVQTRLASVPTGRLMVELTESAEIEHVAAAAAMLASLRARGVPVCLDDFGAGAAAFRYLRDFKVDYVKLDGAYVNAAGDSASDRSLVRSMIDVAHAVDAKVIAEAIESEATLKLMQGMGVDYAQGWLLGRPGRLPGQR